MSVNPKCTYPNCLGIFPRTVLEPCQNPSCTKGSAALLHHACQTEYEYSQNIDSGLSKRCFECTENKNTKTSSVTVAATDIAPQRNDFVPPSSIGGTNILTVDARTCIDTIDPNVPVNMIDECIVPPVVDVVPPENEKNNVALVKIVEYSVKR